MKLKHAPTEQEGWQLTVDDSEIKVAKYMSAKDRAEIEKVGFRFHGFKFKP